MSHGNTLNNTLSEADDVNLIPSADASEHRIPEKISCYRWLKTKVTVEPYLFLYHVMYVGFFTMTQQYLLMRFEGANDSQHEHGASTCNITEIINATNNTNGMTSDADADIDPQTKTTYYLLMLDVVMYSFSFPVTLYFGASLTRWGCKNVLIISAIGTLVRLVIYITVVYYHLELYWLFIGNAIEGLCGSMTVVVMTWTSYIAFITTAKNRAFRIMIAELSVAFGLMIGSVIIGQLIKHVGYVYTYIFMLGLTILSVLYIILFITDIRDSRIREPLKVVLSKTYRLFFHASSYRWILYINCASLMAVIITEHGMSTVNVLYALNAPFCVTSTTIGYLAGEMMFVNNVGMLLLVKFGKKTLGEIGIMIVGCISGFCRHLIYSIAQNVLWLYLAVLPGAFMRVIHPMTKSLCSNAVSTENQGPLFAGISIISQISTMAGTVLWNTIYAQTVDTQPGLVFSLAAVVCAINLILTLVQLMKTSSAADKRDDKVLENVAE